MIIPVSRPQRQLLQNNDVMETFANALDEQDITVEVSTLHTERIAVTRGDPDVAKRCLASVVPAETVKFGVDDDEAISLLQDLRHKFPSGFAVHFGRGMADVAFLPSIRGEVLPVLENVKYARKLVPLPPCLADFVRRHLQCFEADLSREISHPADLSITFDSNNQPFLQLKCDKASIPEAQRVVEKTLALLCITQKDVKRSLGLYLQSPDGRRQAHDIEENSGCAISAMTQDERVLVSARSPGGHQVMVCEGSLETTDCRVLVLPLCDGQTEWTPSQKCILERGGYCVSSLCCCCSSSSSAITTTTTTTCIPAGSPSRVGDVAVYVSDINQPSLPTLLILFLCLFLSLVYLCLLILFLCLFLSLVYMYSPSLICAGFSCILTLSACAGFSFIFTFSFCRILPSMTCSGLCRIFNSLTSADFRYRSIYTLP